MTKNQKSQTSITLGNVIIAVVAGVLLAAVSLIFIFLFSAVVAEYAFGVGILGLVLSGIGLFVSTITEDGSARRVFARTPLQWTGIFIGFVGMSVTSVGVVQSAGAW